MPSSCRAFTPNLLRFSVELIERTLRPRSNPGAWNCGSTGTPDFHITISFAGNSRRRRPIFNERRLQPKIYGQIFPAITQVWVDYANYQTATGPSDRR